MHPILARDHMSIAQIERRRTELGLTYDEIAAAPIIHEGILDRARGGHAEQGSSAGVRARTSIGDDSSPGSALHPRQG